MKMRQSLTMLMGFAMLFADGPPLPAQDDVLKILNPTPEFNDQFGISFVAVGSNILVGVPNDDTVETTFPRHPGTAAPTAGAAYLMDGTTGGLLQTFFSPEAAPAYFGSTVAVAGDANFLVTGTGFSNNQRIEHKS